MAGTPTVEAGVYTTLLPIPDEHRFQDVKGREQVEEMNRLIAGKRAFIVKVDDEGDCRVSTEDGRGTWWPFDCMEPTGEVSTIVDLGQVDVTNCKQVRDAVMSLVERIEFLGGPVRLAGIVEDLRSHGDTEMFGGRTSRMMLEDAVKNKREKKEALGGLGGLMAMLGGGPPR